MQCLFLPQWCKSYKRYFYSCIPSPNPLYIYFFVELPIYKCTAQRPRKSTLLESSQPRTWVHCQYLDVPLLRSCQVHDCLPRTNLELDGQNASWSVVISACQAYRNGCTEFRFEVPKLTGDHIRSVSYILMSLYTICIAKLFRCEKSFNRAKRSEVPTLLIELIFVLKTMSHSSRLPCWFLGRTLQVWHLVACCKRVANNLMAFNFFAWFDGS